MGKESGYRMARLICPLLMTVIIILTGSEAFSAENNIKWQSGPTKTAEVTLQRKMRSSLLTKEMRVVRVSAHTSYVDETGRRTSYDLLSVPCKVVLVYEPEPQADPAAVSITVKQLLPGSSRTIEVVPQ